MAKRAPPASEFRGLNDSQRFLGTPGTDFDLAHLTFCGVNGSRRGFVVFSGRERIARPQTKDIRK
jgi:hypothetical protein